MTSAPSNLIPVRVTQLPIDPTPSENGQMVYTRDGNTYRVRVGDLLQVSGVPLTRQVIAGTGLTGGGQLSSNVTLSIAPGGVGSTQLANTGVAPGVYGSSGLMPVLTIDAQGRITAASTTPISSAGLVPDSRMVLAGPGLTGGGPLSSNVTLAANFSNSTPLAGFQAGVAGISTTLSRADHQHPAVNLALDDEVDGILGLNNGGTAKSLVPQPGAVVWSGADGLYIGPAGVSGQVLVSGGTSAPTWGTALLISPQTANTVFAGPASGAPADPTFRSLVNDDIPITLSGKTLTLSTITSSAITGSTINSTTIGASVPSTGVFTGATADYLQLNTAAAATIALAKLRWNVDTNTASFGIIDGTQEVNIGQQMYAYVTNAEAFTITRGQAVYLYQAQGNRATVKLASNLSDATSAKTFGLVVESIGANQSGFVITQGVLDKVNTSAYSQGDTLYLGTTAGSLTSTKPYAPNHLVYVGIVERANAGNGQIYVRVQNGYELDEIHDVLITSPTTGQTLVYDGTTSLWKNSNAPVLSSATGLPLSTGVTGTLATSNGGTGLSSVGTSNQILGVNNGATGLEYKTLTAGANVTITQGVGTVTIASSNPGGTVTSVDVSGGTTGLTTSGGPVTSSGTITLAGVLNPASGGTGVNNGTNTLTIGASASVSGSNTGDVTLATNSGLGFTSGQTGLALGTPTTITGATTNSVTTNTHTHAITGFEPTLTKGNLTETGSSVLTITGGTGAVIGSGTTIQVAQASGSQSGFLSSTDWTTFNNKQNALTFPLASSLGGTGLSSIGTANQILGVNSAASALEYKTLTAGANVTITQGVGTVTIASSNPGGTVTSVGLAMPTQFAVTNSPVTGSGTLTAAWNTQTANTVLAGPTTGAAAVPTFRALASSDIPALSYVSSVGATAPITSTGGLTPTIGVTAAALTKTDDTNVTLTLGGSPTTSLLAATSLTLGWTGQLGLTRGGTNASLTATAGAVVYSTSTAFALTAAGTTGQWLRSTGTTAPAWTSPAALTKTDDTNVTLTLGGSASTALLNAASLTLGWTGQLSPARGGTGIDNGTRTLTVSTNSGTLSFTNASTTLTIANTGSISGTNTGDVTLATNSGLAFTSGQTGLALGTPSNVTSSSTNSVTTSTHTHAITAGLGFIGNGSAQNQIPVTGATPFTPTWTSISSISGQINHNSTTNLTTGDVHTQYALLAGRTGGQTLIGSTQVGGNLTLQSTSNATKGSLIFGTSRYDELNNRLGINTTPQAPLHVRSSSIIFEDDNTAAAGPVLYITDSGQISAGANATEFAFFVAGPGSTTNTQGPYFLARGNNFSRIANQRGLLSFAAGNVTTPVGSDGIIQFITASSEAMRITTTQDVGIGATTVGSRLVVRGSGATSATSALNVTNSAGTSALFVRNDGFVGINTITPNDNLTIDLGSAASPDAGLTISGSTSSVGDIGLKLSNTGAGGRTWYLDSTNDGSGYGGGKLVFVRDVAGLTAMTIDSAGKLGLGTTFPSFDVSFFADAAKTIAIEDSASGVAGWELTVRAGNTVANTNFAGGQLTLASGRASGSGASSIVLQTGASAASGVLQTLTTRLTINNAGDFTFFDGADFILGTTTGTKIGTATTQKIGFFNATPIVRPTAYTQTYATADKTMAARTAAALTNNTGGTVSTTLAAITAGATYTQADMVAVKNALASIADQINKLRTDSLDTTDVVNAIIDDLQALGLVG